MYTLKWNYGANETLVFHDVYFFLFDRTYALGQHFVQLTTNLSLQQFLDDDNRLRDDGLVAIGQEVHEAVEAGVGDLLDGGGAAADRLDGGRHARPILPRDVGAELPQDGADVGRRRHVRHDLQLEDLDVRRVGGADEEVPAGQAFVLSF